MSNITGLFQTKSVKRIVADISVRRSFVGRKAPSNGIVIATLVLIAGICTCEYAASNPISAKANKTFARSSSVFRFDDPSFFTDATATPDLYLVSYVDGLGDGEREPDEAEGGTTGGGFGESGMSGGEFGSPPEPAIPSEICSAYGATLVEVFDGLGVFVATMTETQARAMSHDPDVEFVEGDREGDGDTVQTLTSETAFWGLDLIDLSSPYRNNTFVYGNSGVGVHAYILDSGIFISNNEFGGRATADVTFVGPTPIDTVGHGTAVAGTIGGATVGVAKNSILHSVRVLDDFNRFKLVRLLRGINWVKDHRIMPAVVNMSLGAPRIPYIPFITMGTPPIEKGVRRLVNLGITVVVSAGNRNAPANGYVPARVEVAITVGACDSSRNRTDFTNFGYKIDIFAPGLDVMGANMASSGYSGGWWGTSLSAPFVTGVVCQYLQTNPLATPAQVQQWLKDHATQNVITGTFPVTTTRRFLLSVGL